MNNVKFHREKLRLTQSDLADRSNLSLRTIQRVEAGNGPKGHTLKTLAAALLVDESELIDVDEKGLDQNQLSRVRLMNTLAFSFLFLPYANIIFPVLVWKKNKDVQFVNTEGAKIINFQIFWTLTTSLLLLISPYLQKTLLLNFPLILWVLAVAYAINLIMLIRTSILLKKEEILPHFSPIRFL